MLTRAKLESGEIKDLQREAMGQSLKERVRSLEEINRQI
jgi:hypothetical protein